MTTIILVEMVYHFFYLRHEQSQQERHHQSCFRDIYTPKAHRSEEKKTLGKT